MKKQSKVPDKKDKSKKITSKEEDIPLKKIARILDIPEDELKKLPDGVLERITEVSVKKSYFLGPLPPPSIVRGYEEILAGSFDRLLQMAERNADHRIAQDKHDIEMEKQLVPESIENRKSGQNKAFFISIFGIIAVCFCAYIGETTVASILAGTTLISLVPNFISGIKKRLEKEKLDQNNDN